MSEQAKITHIGTLIDSSIEQIESELKDYSYTHLCNIKKLLEGEYQKVETLKDSLIAHLKGKECSNELAEEVILQLYISLQKIEDRAALVEALKKEKMNNKESKGTVKN